MRATLYRLATRGGGLETVVADWGGVAAFCPFGEQATKRRRKRRKRIEHIFKC